MKEPVNIYSCFICLFSHFGFQQNPTNPNFEKADLHYYKEAVYTLTTNLRGRIRRAHELERPILSMNKAEAEAG